MPAPGGGRRWRAVVRSGKAIVHLGAYDSAALAALAVNLAWERLHPERRPPNPVAPADRPAAAAVGRMRARVLRRLGREVPADRDRGRRRDHPPPSEALRTMFEVAVVGFWRGQVAAGVGSARDLEAAARRLAEAARLLFWSDAAGHPEPAAVLAELLAARLDRTFGRADVTRAVLDDDGDEPERAALWLVLPDELAGGRFPSREVARAHPDLLAGFDDGPLDWAAVLGVAPPFSAAQVRAAYRRLSKEHHPDTGGDPRAFVRLQAAYEAARRHVDTHAP